MGLRAAYLLLIFLPFMLLAPLLFVLARLLLRWGRPRSRQPRLNGERLRDPFPSPADSRNSVACTPSL